MPMIIAIIPARMAATRFPGKPLADILGLPMVEHVRRRVSLCPLINEVVVATCDREIYESIESHGGRAVMTSDIHERCTDRIAEAALNTSADIIINVQGDEPLVHPDMFSPLLGPLLRDSALHCTNLMSEITNDEDFLSPNVVKTVCDPDWNVLYFSREPIPSLKKAGNLEVKKFRQLGIIAFRRDFLNLFSSLPQTPLEKVESVDMLRAIESGYKVRMVVTPFQIIGVDTPKDLERARAMMAEDPLFKVYR